MYSTFFPIPILAALLLLTSLPSCQTAGSGRISSTDPEIIQAKKALLDSLGDWTVNCKWITAEKTTNVGGVSPSFDKERVSSDIETATYHYSNWKVSDDGILKGSMRWNQLSKLDSGYTAPSSGNSDSFSISIQNVASVHIHDRERSAEAAKELFDNRLNFFGGKSVMLNELAENLTGAATVEFRMKTSDYLQKYQQIYFPNKQRAQVFLERWNKLISAMRKR